MLVHPIHLSRKREIHYLEIVECSFLYVTFDLHFNHATLIGTIGYAQQISVILQIRLLTDLNKTNTE